MTDQTDAFGVPYEKNPPLSNKGGRTVVLKKSSAAIDWITATSNNDAIGLQWLELYKRVKKQHPVWESSRYLKGFTGMGFDGLQWLYNPKSGFYMVVASSDTAASIWAELAQHAKNITRIDLAVTIEFSEPLELYILRQYDTLTQEEKIKRSYALVLNTEYGATMYVGKRSSQAYGRLYDKGVESDSHQPGNRFRYEVEIKKPMAQPVALGIMQGALKGQVQRALIADYVGEWFKARGVYVPWESGGNHLEIDVEVSVTTPIKRLSWLKTQVSPTVKELIDMGLGRNVIEALRLQDYVQPDLFDLGDDHTSKDD
jgi:hypothetical protein